MTTEEITKELEYILRVNDQPCQNYEVDLKTDSGLIGGDPFVHHCPRCHDMPENNPTAFRAMCKNCVSDHHKGGWLKCDIALLIKNIKNDNQK